jgi:hypothetical protein
MEHLKTIGLLLVIFFAFFGVIAAGVHYPIPTVAGLIVSMIVVVYKPLYNEIKNKN